MGLFTGAGGGQGEEDRREGRGGGMREGRERLGVTESESGWRLVSAEPPSRLLNRSASEGGAGGL